jgi:hypothetical protein
MTSSRGNRGMPDADAGHSEAALQRHKCTVSSMPAAHEKSSSDRSAGKRMMQ